MHRIQRFVMPAILAALALGSAAQARPSFQMEVYGHGPAMILIPGLNSSGATWDSTVAHFQHQYTCYVLTRPASPVRRRLTSRCCPPSAPTSRPTSAPTICSISSSSGTAWAA